MDRLTAFSYWGDCSFLSVVRLGDGDSGCIGIVHLRTDRVY